METACCGVAVRISSRPVSAILKDLKNHESKVWDISACGCERAESSVGGLREWRGSEQQPSAVESDHAIGDGYAVGSELYHGAVGVGDGEGVGVGRRSDGHGDVDERQL
jgi:hypothetical protein